MGLRQIHLQKLNPTIAIILLVAAALTFPVFSCMRSLDLDESLYGAAQQGNVEEMRRLLDRGANPSAMFDSSNPVLVAAIQSGKPEAVRLLLEHHADPNIIGAYHSCNRNRTLQALPRHPGHARQSRRSRLRRAWLTNPAPKTERGMNNLPPPTHLRPSASSVVRTGERQTRAPFVFTHSRIHVFTYSLAKQRRPRARINAESSSLFRRFKLQRP